MSVACQPSTCPLAFCQLVTLMKYGACRDCSISISTFKLCLAPANDVRVKSSIKVTERLQLKPPTHSDPVLKFLKCMYI